MIFLSKLIRSSLLHFIIIGSLIYWGVGEDAVKQLTLSEKQSLFDAHKKKLSINTLTKIQKNEVLDRYYRDEALYQEALSLGLDVRDHIVRQRLVQKMEFLAKDFSDKTENVSDFEIANYYRENLKKWIDPEKLIFDHIFSRSLVELQKIKNSESKIEPGKMGAPFSLGHQIGPISNHFLRQKFNFSQDLFQLNLNSWSEPIESKFGYHLIRIIRKSPKTIASLESLKEEIYKMVIIEKNRKSVNSYLEKIVSKRRGRNIAL
jgi:peptidyl-prolyl cis-trans isomerase C